MSEEPTFARLVRTRMVGSGEDAATARAAILAARSEDAAPGVPALPTSDEAAMRGTERGWEAWFDVLDECGARERPHAEIARWLVETHAVDAWWAQSLTVGYERARGGRSLGERPDGFAVSASKTVAASAEATFDAFVDPRARSEWLPDDELRERTASRPKSARFDWSDGATRVHIHITAKGDAKASLSVNHERLRDGDEAERMKAYWRERLAAFKSFVER